MVVEVGAALLHTGQLSPFWRDLSANIAPRQRAGRFAPRATASSPRGFAFAACRPPWGRPSARRARPPSEPSLLPGGGSVASGGGGDVGRLAHSRLWRARHPYPSALPHASPPPPARLWPPSRQQQPAPPHASPRPPARRAPLPARRHGQEGEEGMAMVAISVDAIAAWARPFLTDLLLALLRRIAEETRALLRPAHRVRAHPEDSDEVASRLDQLARRQGAQLLRERRLRQVHHHPHRQRGTRCDGRHRPSQPNLVPRSRILVIARSTTPTSRAAAM